MCGGAYAIVFTQHKGATLVETVQLSKGSLIESRRSESTDPWAV